jgi:hypothetical protein
VRPNDADGGVAHNTELTKLELVLVGLPYFVGTVTLDIGDCVLEKCNSRCIVDCWPAWNLKLHGRGMEVAASYKSLSNNATGFRRTVGVGDGPNDQRCVSSVARIEFGVEFQFTISNCCISAGAYLLGAISALDLASKVDDRTVSSW